MRRSHPIHLLASTAAVAARLDSIAQAAAGDGFAGLVVVHRGGREILARGYGLANRATERGERVTIGFALEPGGLLRGLRVQVG